MSDKNKKPHRLKARQPRGFIDRSSADIRATDLMMSKIREVYERYGFDPVETPMFEYTDALGKFLPDTDRPNAGVFSLQDDDEQWMSLRYDLTAPLARYFAQNINELQTPYRTYRSGWVFRNEKPGPGRFRQFMQFDADTVGAPNPSADAEMCMMMADTMEALGIKRGDYVVRVNNRKVLDGVLEAIGLVGDDHADTRLTVLRSLDKRDKFEWPEIEKLLGKGRKDESGDFTPGANLSEKQISDLKQFIRHSEKIAEIYFPEAAQNYGTDTETAERKLEHVRNGFSFLGSNDALYLGIEELISIHRLCAAAGYVKKSGSSDIPAIVPDPSVVRGLEYYTGAVYECELTFPVTNEKGETVTFGSVAGGGRYDGLVKRFTGQDIPATGFSIGVSRLMTALKNLGKLGGNEIVAPVVVCVMDRDPESVAGYQKMVQTLRRAGIRAEMYQGNPKQFGKQLQYADRRGSPIAIIQGSDERSKGEVQIKDLIEGKRIAEQITDNKEWRSSRPAQQLVKVDDLVNVVRETLAAQKADGAA